ncbi:MAG: YjjG family noncanonical pyrimidine nucleotidase [Paludibacter sp.]|nr:YjjG family noncanonical pyrimidine nucleotidase [Paludibacter sp.]MDD4199494.1 YjjG family noncanonical pyrimidine nucleotidase [Paludibacter sp.]MDD4428257.1 YjjG family noncanonical pyrimidine nucleotidase [Paludibacter sp.]
MYKFVFIDLDDTIWDFHTNARLSLQQMFDEGNLKKHFKSFDEFFTIYAKKNIELWEAYGKGEITRDFLMAERFRYPLARMGVDDLQMAEEIGHQYLEILPTKTALMADAIEILDYLKQKYTLSLISNGFTEVQYKKINSSGIGHYFSHIILSEEAGALKPDPKIFEHALQLNRAAAHETIMIGDSYEADIRGAQQAGIDQVYFPLNGHYKENQPATYKISRLMELKNIL